MRAIRLTGLVILVSSLVILAVFGGWPSFDSVLGLVGVGLIGGVLLGVFLRFLIPRKKRYDFTYGAHPGLAKRLLRRPPKPDEAKKDR